MNWIIIAIDTIIMCLSIIPAIIFHKKYRIIPLKEFEIFSMIFYCVVLSVAGELGAILFDVTIFYQIQFLALISIYYLMFGYALRVHFQKTPFYQKFIMRFYFLSLVGIILFWRKMHQPEKSKMLFWDVSATSTAYYPEGAGLMVDDAIILSTSYYFLVSFFILICLLWYLFSVGSVNLVIEYQKIKIAKILWIVVALFNLLWVFLVLPWTPNFQEANALIIMQLFVIVYIVLKIPEGMIISNSQFFRSYDLLVEIMSKEEQKKYRDMIGTESFFEYLELVLESLEPKSKDIQ